MNNFVLGTSSTEQWINLVKEAQSVSNQNLAEELESYLVFLLMRFTDKPEMAAGVLALEYLSSRLNDPPRHDQLRDMGDKCLLYSGLFPHRADRLHVSISYFVNLGRSAYAQLSEYMDRGAAVMYHQLALAFIPLMDVLQAMRELGDPGSRLQPLHAFELWQETGSRHALRILSKTTEGTPVVQSLTDPKYRS